MKLWLVTVIYEHGTMVGGVFSTEDSAKEATEILCAATVPDMYGDLYAGSVQELELDKTYSGEDRVPTHDFSDGAPVVEVWFN